MDDTVEINQEVETALGTFRVVGNVEIEHNPNVFGFDISIEPVDIDGRAYFDDYEACKQAVVKELNKIDWEV